jgi:hypothetical protein
MDAAFLKSKHQAAMPYQQYVSTGTAAQQQNWQKVYDQAHLSTEQARLVGSFVRQINVLVISGVWCGDCVQQGPLIQRIAEAGPRMTAAPGGTDKRSPRSLSVPSEPEAGSARIDLRWLDRDAHPDLADQVRICGGKRVPTVLFCAEDFEFVSILGDRTLSRYRAIAQRQLGPSCPLPGAPIDRGEMEATLQDWLNEFERVHLLLRLSPRLRQKHGD